jgi:pantoate--beta-alanine ligase
MWPTLNHALSPTTTCTDIDAMKIVDNLADLRATLRPMGACAFVPTMGNLHQGHVALVQKAQQHHLPVVVSVFVNRLQFAPHEDFDQYPRTLEQDAQKLRQAGVQVLFAPNEQALYPQSQTCKVMPDPALADILEGQFRPGFFTGVSTVVMKLFQCVQPALAVFGKKDYQQLKVIEHMVCQLALPITIDALDTCRAQDGLALSSRNAYLNPQERAQAPQLLAALRQLAQQYQASPHHLTQIEAQTHHALQAQGWQSDYLTVRRRDNLQPPSTSHATTELVALGAARLGKARLIDNLEFEYIPSQLKAIG